jgi:hypothetical protein
VIEIYEWVKQLTKEDVKKFFGHIAKRFSDFDKKWNDKNVFRAIHFQGYVIGYALLNYLLAVLTDGAIEMAAGAEVMGSLDATETILGEVAGEPELTNELKKLAEETRSTKAESVVDEAITKSKPSDLTPKAPAPPPLTMTNATTTQIAALKKEGFAFEKVSDDARTALFQNPTTRQKAVVTLRQGGPSWANSGWGRARLESEMRMRGFVLNRETRGEGGLLYRNSATREEIRIMPKPPNQWENEAIEKHLSANYYKYRPNGDVEWGPHTLIPDKD